MTDKELEGNLPAAETLTGSIIVYPRLPDDIVEVILIDSKGEEQKCTNLRKPWRTDVGAVAKFDDITNAIFITKLNGKRYYKINGNDLRNLLPHRLDGPAIEYANGYLAHYVNGEKHGAVIFAGNVCSIWDKGIRILPEQKENNDTN